MRSSFTDKLIHRFNIWLGSRKGFVQSVVFTLLWVPLVIWRVDSHGFIYLYLATALSLITNFSLAIYARRLQEDSEKFEQLVLQLLKNQQDTMLFLIQEAKEWGEQLDEIEEKSSQVLPMVDRKLETQKGLDG